MNVVIRPAQQRDIDDIVALGVEMHAQSTYASMAYDSEQVWRFLNYLLENDGHEVFVCETGKGICGMLAGSVMESFFGPDLTAVEYFWYITPDHRQSGLGHQLLTAYRDWAKQQGAVRIQAGNSAGMPDAVYVKLLNNVGMQRAGSLMYADI